MGFLSGLALCAGAGGLELGLSIAMPSYRTVCYVEREANAAATLVARMEDETLDRAPVWDDLKTFRGRELRDLVDIVTAGYPCQPFSAAGKRLGEKDERHLWPHVRRIISQVRPPYVFLENVRGHLSMGFDRVLSDLTRLGFDAEWCVVGAADVGAPHRRQRVFVLAYRRGMADPRRIATHGAQRRGGKPGGAETNPSGDWEAMAEPLGNGLQGQLPPGAEEGAALVEGGALAVSDCKCDEWPGDAGPRGWGEHPNSCRELGDAGAGRHPGGAFAGLRQPEGWVHSDGSAIWPPGPGDAEAWARIAPEAQPAIRGVANGMASRVDRLRLCGNGVVPLAAAYAFRTLAARIKRRN